MPKNNRVISGHILISAAVIILTLLALLRFVEVNNARILEQNESYIENATAVSAGHINRRLENAAGAIRTITAFAGLVTDVSDQNAANIADLDNNSIFDQLLYMPADGNDTPEPLADIFQHGMQEETGISLVHLQENGETVQYFAFYAPLKKQEEITGVICGLYGDSHMKGILEREGSFFGAQARSYLCTDDGTVITSFGVENPAANILDSVKESDNFIGKSEKIFFQVFEERKSQAFTYQYGSVDSMAYITPLAYNDWVLIQIFPPEVTRRMQQEANRAGIILVSCVVLGFLSYIIFLLMMKRRSERSLQQENEEISRIVERVTTLFSRFAVADLKNDAYYYVAKADGIPPAGKYTDLMQYMSQFYIDEEGYTPMMDVVSPARIQENLTEDRDFLRYEYHINRNGEDRWENVSLICLKRENGKAVSILYAVQNITELKQKELESRIALKNAFDAAKAADSAKSEFLSRMSHDIRTPMNAVMGMTAVAAMHLDDKERLADCLNKITASSKHLLALINDILDMSKIESGKVTLSEEPFNLAELTESIMTIMQPEIKAKRQKLSMSTSGIVHEDLLGDTLRLRQVFVNIMGNAVKFTPESGSISLDIRELESRIPGKAQYEFIFTDTGIGMEQSFIDKIFEPFSRAKNPDAAKIEGTGLGMPIANNIIKMMDGDIKVESKRGEGSKFTVRLHLTIQHLDAADAVCLNGLPILVADDDPSAAENTREILSSIGMDAVSVLGGAEAVEEVVRRHEAGEGFAAVILDWQMPELNGVAATAEIRRRIGESIPIVILSAYDWSDIEQEARQKGVDAFIAKPLFRSRLIYVLKSLIGPKEPSEVAQVDSFTEMQFAGKRVLLTEDNELNREIACELLEMIGVEVETAFDGQEAVETLESKPPHYYDLVFMDIQMPRMNGYEAATAIRASKREDLKTIPIVAMSADAFTDDVYHAKECGMNDHVAKPVEIPKLAEALEKWLS